MSLRKKIIRSVVGTLLAGVAVLAVAALTAAPAQATVPFHEIVGQGSHKCLDVRAEDGVGNRNARIQTWQCFGSPNQEWGILFAGQYSGVDYFQFVGKTTGTYAWRCGALRSPTVHRSISSRARPTPTNCGGSARAPAATRSR